MATPKPNKPKAGSNSDKIDAVYDAAIAANRRRIEYPSLNENLTAAYQRMSPDRPTPADPVIREECRQLIETEATKCDGDRPLGDDFMIFEELIGHDPDHGEMLKALYWRGRIQTAVLDVFTVLCNRGFLDPNCLRLPVTYYKVCTPVATLTWLLDCYEGPQKEHFLHEPKPFRYHDQEFSGPFVWLATMILRCCADIDKVLETITACGSLGELDTEAFETWKKYTTMKHFEVNPREMAGGNRIEPAEFGFWLPHGLLPLGDIDDDDDDEKYASLVRDHIHIFNNRIERVFRDYFNVSHDEMV
ncbi:MAG: hypothetical protein Q9191_008339 [Dirinaria sp. TL-2023a]